MRLSSYADVGVLNKNGGDRKQSYKTENVTLTDRGNSTDYRTAKLKRDHPDVAKRLVDGEFKNVSEAERAAGIGRKKMSAVEKVFNAYNRLGDSEKDEFDEMMRG